jgi:hypothetical protein
MSIEAMKQMVEALQKAKRQCQYHNIAPHLCYDDAIEVGLKAIAEAEKQKPLCTAAMFDEWFLAKSGLDPKTPLYTHPQPKREPLTEWKPIETAPKDTEVLLYCNKLIPLYIGKKRYGCLGEPQQDEFEWRCSSSGRFANPTYWMPLPKSPIEAAHGIKE